MIDSKQWFDVPDSKTKDESGEGGFFYNVEARFADHPILDVKASKAKRHNVYFYGPVLHMRIKKTSLGAKAIKNAHSVVMRFDKGHEDIRIEAGIGPQGNSIPVRVGSPGMGKEDFDRACKLIVRCWEAWEHYQKFRKSVVTELEQHALEIISQAPSKLKGRIMAGRDGGILEVDDVHDEQIDDDPDFTPEADAVIIDKPSTEAKPRGRKKAA